MSTGNREVLLQWLRQSHDREAARELAQSLKSRSDMRRELVQLLRSTDVEERGVAIDGVFEHVIHPVAIHLSRRVGSNREMRLRWLRHRGDEVLVDLARRTLERLLRTLDAYDPDQCDLGTWTTAHAVVVLGQILAAVM
jgi:hypothetical protein